MGCVAVEGSWAMVTNNRARGDGMPSQNLVESSPPDDSDRSNVPKRKRSGRMPLMGRAKTARSEIR